MSPNELNEALAQARENHREQEEFIIKLLSRAEENPTGKLCKFLLTSDVNIDKMLGNSHYTAFKYSMPTMYSLFHLILGGIEDDGEITLCVDNDAKCRIKFEHHSEISYKRRYSPTLNGVTLFIEAVTNQETHELLMQFRRGYERRFHIAKLTARTASQLQELLDRACFELKACWGNNSFFCSEWLVELQEKYNNTLQEFKNAV